MRHFFKWFLENSIILVLSHKSQKQWWRIKRFCRDSTERITGYDCTVATLLYFSLRWAICIETSATRALDNSLTHHLPDSRQLCDNVSATVSVRLAHRFAVHILSCVSIPFLHAAVAAALQQTNACTHAWALLRGAPTYAAHCMSKLFKPTCDISSFYKAPRWWALPLITAKTCAPVNL